MGPPITRLNIRNTPLSVERPGKRVADDQATHECRAPPSQAKPDGPAPVLHHHREVPEAEAIHEVLQHITMLFR
jgi:hypothetical protein